MKQEFELQQVKSAGYSLSELKERFGYPLRTLKEAFSPVDLKGAGFSIDSLAGELKPSELRQAFSAQELAQHLTKGKMKLAGFTIKEVMDAFQMRSIEELRSERDGNGYLWAEGEFKKAGFKAAWICEEGHGVHQWGSGGWFSTPEDQCKECKKHKGTGCEAR